MCDVKFQSMEVLSVHMAKIHQESDHCMLLRLTKTFESVRDKESMKVNSVQKLKDFSYVECGEFFKTLEMQKNHNEKIHKCKIIQNKVIGVDSDSEEETEEYDDLAFYDIEYTPKEPSQDEKVGVSFKGDTEEFEFAHKALENMMSKSKVTYNVEGIEVSVKTVPKAGRITVEVITMNGDKGCVGLQFHNPKKGKKSFRLTKPKGQESKIMTTLAEQIFKPLLRGLISGDMNEASLKRLQKKTSNKNVKSSVHKKNPVTKQQPFNCEVCGLIFPTGSMLATHRKTHEIKCEMCDFVAKLPNELLEHMKMCHKKENETKCVRCDFTFKTIEKLLEHKKLCHIKVQTGGPSKPLQCDRCLDVLSNKPSLEKHI